MGERILIMKLTIFDGLKMFGAKPENAFITRDLIKLSRGARSSYLNHLEAQRECNTDQEEAMRKK